MVVLAPPPQVPQAHSLGACAPPAVATARSKYKMYFHPAGGFIPCTPVRRAVQRVPALEVEMVLPAPRPSV